MFKIDMTGKACPLPVIQTHKALKEHDVVETIVDNKIATENLKRLADQLGCMYTLTEEATDRYVVVIAKNGQEAVSSPVAEAGADGGSDLRLRRLPQFLRADG